MINKYEDYKTPNEGDAGALDHRNETPWDYDDYEMAEMTSPDRDEAARAIGESAVNMVNTEFINDGNSGVVEEPTGGADIISVHDADATEVGQFHLPGVDDFHQ